MPPSPEGVPTSSDAAQKPHQSQQQQRKKQSKSVQKEKTKSPKKFEDGGRDRCDERVEKIYPKEITATTSRNTNSTSPSHSNQNASTSPLLAAIGTTAAAAQYTSEWTKTLPFFAASPAGQKPIPIAGSPPHLGLTQATREGSTGHTPSSQSPPMLGGRPVSYPNHFPSIGSGPSQQVFRQSPGHDRRLSMYSHSGSRPPFQINPPLPHLPQPHMHSRAGLDLDYGVSPIANARPGEAPFYCGLDTLSNADCATLHIAPNVALLGYEGGVDVLRVRARSMDVLGRLEGLRGSVIGARVVSHAGRSDGLGASHPLVALIIHGPSIKASKDVTNAHGESQAASEDDENTKTQEVAEQTLDVNVVEYQTTVEVYSLQTAKHVATLLECPPVALVDPISSPVFRPPLPTGNLRLHTCGNLLTVSSGSSGEVFVFSPLATGTDQDDSNSPSFRCLGKFWTTIQMRQQGTASSGSSSAGAQHADLDDTATRGVALLSLSPRWLALVAPSTSQQQSLNAVVKCLKGNAMPPGVSHHSPPPQPNETCALDVPQNEGLAGWFAREGTQTAVRGAKWAADKGLQAFNYYRGKPTQTTDITSVMASPHGADPLYQFPPTHDQLNIFTPSKESGLVSIYDLRRLLDHEQGRRKGALDPIASFMPAHGVSHLSFSPAGTMLMTVSKKGDVQDVWSLFRLAGRRAKRVARGSMDGPHVRQVARFTRMTVANVVDVAWSPPTGRNLAILTENGTVHLYPMPSAAFSWPPARLVQRPSVKSNTTDAAPKTTAVAGVMSAWSTVQGTAKSLYRRQSENDPNKTAGFGISLTGTMGTKSAKTAARQLGRGIGQTAQNFAHAGDNKIHLQLNGRQPSVDSLRWNITKHGQQSIVVLHGDKVDVAKLLMTPARGKQHPARVKKGKTLRFTLPLVRGGPFPPWLLSKLRNPPQDTVMEGFWAHNRRPLSTNPRTQARRPNSSIARPAHPLSFAELESSAPFLPSHTDKRVTMFHTTVDALDSALPATHHLVSDTTYSLYASPPTFGAPVLGRRVHASRSSPAGHSDLDDEDLNDAMENLGLAGAQTQQRIVRRSGEGEFDEVEITTHTRRRRKGDDGMDGAEGEGEAGFFEDDCMVLDFADERV